MYKYENAHTERSQSFYFRENGFTVPFTSGRMGAVSVSLAELSLLHYNSQRITALSFNVKMQYTFPLPEEASGRLNFLIVCMARRAFKALYHLVNKKEIQCKTKKRKSN